MVFRRLNVQNYIVGRAVTTAVVVQGRGGSGGGDRP